MIGGMDTELPASSFPCSSCHGERGQGQAERGVAPSDLSRDALTRPYTVSAAAGRVRPPYDRALFERAITRGVDSGGTALADAMPRFNLSPADVSDLWAFLDKLKDEAEPGLNEGEVRIGVALPLSGPAWRTGQSMRGVLDALRADLNAAGGIHGRSLVFIPYDEAGGEPVPDEVFAVLGAQRPVPDVPTISDSFVAAPGALGFMLTAGDTEQIAALRAFAVTQFGATSIAELEACNESSTPAEGVTLLRDASCAEAGGTAARLLVPFRVFSQISPEVRKEWPASVSVALPIAVDRISEGAQRGFARVRSRSRVPGMAPIAEANIYSSAVVAIEALMRAGRGVTRKRFTERLESIQGFVGAMTPPLNYSANDHVGSNGAFIVSYDPEAGQLSSAGVWIDPTGEAH